jgi:hypothetical protein
MHAVIESGVDGVGIIDLGSRLGTNGSKVNRATLLSGDEIRVGSTRIRVLFSSDDETQSDPSRMTSFKNWLDGWLVKVALFNDMKH